MGRLYIVPIFLTEPRFRITSDYVPGIYEVSDSLETGLFRSFITELNRNKQWLVDIISKADCDIQDLFDLRLNDLDQLCDETREQGLNMVALLEQAAKRGLLPVHWLKDIQNLYDGIGKCTPPDPLFKMASEPVEIKHGLFRVYGISFAQDLLVVTDVAIKMTKTMDKQHRSNAENFKSILVDESELTYLDFQGKILELDDSSIAK